MEGFQTTFDLAGCLPLMHEKPGFRQDCFEFHYLIGEKDYHKERPVLQKTWRPLILLLKAFLDDRSDKDGFLRAYQRDR
jgi:hypothetical protein